MNGFSGYIKPELVPIFWDPSPTYWNNPGPNNQTRGQVLGYLQYLVNGPFWGALNQYGVSPPRLAPIAPIDSSYPLPTPSNWNGSTMSPREINDAIKGGIVPPPTAGADMVYVVMVPPGYGEGYLTGTCPYTDSSGTYSCGQYDTNPPTAYRFAYNNADDPLGTVHEITECLTMPSSASNPLWTQQVFGCTAVNGGGQATGIEDICECGPDNGLGNNEGPDGELQDGHWVAAYYSRADKACVIPEGWPGLWYWDTHDGWQNLTTDPIRQYATSGPNIVITDTTDNLYSMNFPFAWTHIGNWAGSSQPSQLAIAGDATHPKVLFFDNDSSSIWLENSFGANSWTQLGLGGLTSGFGSSIISGVDTLATDAYGQPYFWNGSTWKNFGGPADQFIGTGYQGHAVFEINWQHSGIEWYLPNVIPNNGWQSAGSGQDTQLFGSPTSNVIAATDGSFNIYTYQGATTWSRQTSNIGDSLAVLGGGSEGGSDILWWLKRDRTQQSYDSDVWVANGQWTQITTGVLGRIIGSTDFIYPEVFAFGCAGSTGACVLYCLSSGNGCVDNDECCSGVCNSSGTCN